MTEQIPMLDHKSTSVTIYSLNICREYVNKGAKKEKPFWIFFSINLDTNMIAYC